MRLPTCRAATATIPLHGGRGKPCRRRRQEAIPPGNEESTIGAPEPTMTACPRRGSRATGGGAGTEGRGEEAALGGLCCRRAEGSRPLSRLRHAAPRGGVAHGRAGLVGRIRTPRPIRLLSRHVPARAGPPPGRAAVRTRPRAG